MLTFLLLACVTETNFSGHVVGLVCARSEECHKADFESNYDDQGECVEDNGELYEDVVDCYNEHCEFDGKAANEYIADARAADCDNVDEALGDVGDVYDDCDEIDLFGCLLGG
ncbi:MAG: hypothetical protein Q8P18_03135 [Pseudomonadota bacterium]|nr:hypothetical protein [Pseudomonadota bacterium]